MSIDADFIGFPKRSFLNIFRLAGDSIYEFYGKPIVDLSFYQINLVSYGRYFINVLSEMKDKIPENIMSDPDKIIEYVELNKNYERINPNKKESGAGAVVGGNKQDLEILGMKPMAGDALSRKMKEKGHLGKEELLEMLG